MSALSKTDSDNGNNGSNANSAMIPAAGPNALSRKIQALRTSRGWTRNDLSRKLGVSLLTVQNWEEGTSVPAVTRYKVLAKTLGVRLADLGVADGLDPRSLGDRIKFARLANGMSIERFANENGFTIQSVKAMESQFAGVSENLLDRLARSLKMPPRYFAPDNPQPFLI